MSLQINNANANDALSDNELASVSGGRRQVSKKQYELLLAIRMAVAKGA